VARREAAGEGPLSPSLTCDGLYCFVIPGLRKAQNPEPSAFIRSTRVSTPHSFNARESPALAHLQVGLSTARPNAAAVMICFVGRVTTRRRV